MSPLNAAEIKALEGIEPGRMLQLGNKKNLKGPRYVDHLRDMGWDVVNLDISGEDGALAYDLARPARDLWGQFDVLTNFGTSEHVSDQHSVWENIHRLVKPGGYMVHTLAMVDTMPGHCDWFISHRFFVWLAGNNHYRIHDQFTAIRQRGEDGPIAGKLCCARIQKLENNEFTWGRYPDGLYFAPSERSRLKAHGYYPVAENILNSTEEW